jgi:hypothetical protein
VSRYVTASRMLDWAKRDKDPEPGGGQNVSVSRLTITLFRTHTRPQNSGFRKIATRISGSLPALATAGSGGRWHFFCSRNTQLWLLQQRAWGRKCWSRWNARTALSSRTFFHKIAESHDALRVDIQAFSMMSVLVRQRSTISDIVSLESMACSFSDCSKSAGSLN